MIEILSSCPTPKSKHFQSKFTLDCRPQQRPNSTQAIAIKRPLFHGAGALLVRQAFITLRRRFNDTDFLLLSSRFGRRCRLGFSGSHSIPFCSQICPNSVAAHKKHTNRNLCWEITKMRSLSSLLEFSENLLSSEIKMLKSGSCRMLYTYLSTGIIL